MFTSQVEVKEFCFDTSTLVTAYLNLRNLFPHTILLEASDYIPDENCFSYIGINPVASFKYDDAHVTKRYPDSRIEKSSVSDKAEVLTELIQFYDSFNDQGREEYSHLANGLFGYLSYDAIECFDTIKLKELNPNQIPIIYYQAFEFVIAFNNYRNNAYILKNNFHANTQSGLSSDEIVEIISKNLPRAASFDAEPEIQSNISKEEHEEIIHSCKKHIQRGDIFQIVPSRSYTQNFYGDDFLVYRALRHINPSPYLFYFDFGEFRIFGSSPEADLLIKDRKAVIHPIAGTCPNVPDQLVRKSLINKLVNDPKENSEHVMLVDLARNDLNKHCDKVAVENYREVQEFSHVIHLVSVVTGEMHDDVSPFQLLADTFPAGTLTGAPKFRAMELIDHFEPDRREYYGGAIGLVDFNGDCVHAIMIRSFLSRNNQLSRRAGGGVVSESVIANEVDEVKNKLMALENAVLLAGELS